MNHHMYRAQVVAAALAAIALATDAAGSAGLLPGAWPVASYAVLAIVITGGLIIALLRMLHARRGTRARGVGSDLVALGLLLLAWLLRGHREIPPDPPLVAAELIGTALLAFTLWRQRH